VSVPNKFYEALNYEVVFMYTIIYIGTKYYIGGEGPLMGFNDAVHLDSTIKY